MGSPLRRVVAHEVLGKTIYRAQVRVKREACRRRAGGVRVQSYGLAARMRLSAREVLDFSNEPKHVTDLDEGSPNLSPPLQSPKGRDISLATVPAASPSIQRRAASTRWQAF